MFVLDKQLEQDSFFIGDLALSRLLLLNNMTYPWVILVPRKINLVEIIDLSKQDRLLLMEEISLISNIMKELFDPYKLNIASFGNVVRQLHVHIMARYEDDSTWPNPVWVDKTKNKLYDTETKNQIINKIKDKLNDI
jgi:diadenosine tetraphosphate (Ap4A) HIT family hydrolase